MSRFIAYLACLGGLTLPCAAQSITATISGLVRDPGGATIPAAKVVAESSETGLKKTATTDADGRFTIPFLNPGTYTLTAESAGFDPSVRTGVLLEVAQVATVDFALSLKGTRQTVNVVAEMPLLNSDTAGMEHTIEQKLIEDLPSAERSTLALINNLPGVIDTGFALATGENLNTNGNAQGPIGSPGNRNFFDSNFGVGGGQSSTNDVLLDGVSNVVGDFNGVVISPPQDSVQEFKVMSGVFSAEYGRSGGGVVNFVTKSGTRKLHGTLYEYFQNGALNANGWQRNRAGYGPDGVTPRLPRIPIERSQFGGTLGGPVRIPKIGGLKDTFFFFNYEGRREANPFSKQLTMPTAKMRTGDLSELIAPLGRNGVTANFDGSAALLGQVYNPWTLVPNGLSTAAGAPVLVREAFPGNRLDRLPKCVGTGPRTAPCLDPVGLALLTYLPLPNQPGTTDNYLYSGTASFQRDIFAVRLDKTLNERHSLFGRFTREARLQEEPSYLDSVASNSRIIRDKFINGTFNDVFTISPRLLSNFRYGYTRAHAKQDPLGTQAGFDPAVMGFPPYIAAAASTPSFPIFNFSSAGPETQGLPGEISSGQIGGGGNNQPRDTQTLANAFTWIQGRHNIKFGVEYRLLRFFANQNQNPTGTYTFNRTFTRGPSPTTAPAVAAEAGSSLASLLLGLPASLSFATVTPITLYHHYGAAFVHDDWRVNSKLVLNVGLRWDLETPTAETHGQVTTFDLDKASPLNGQVGAPSDPLVQALRPNFRDLRGFLSFADGPQSEINYNRFAPRIGLAWRVTERTTFRGGYGIGFVPQSVEQSSAIGVNFNLSPAQGVDSTQNVVQPGGTANQTVFLTNPFVNSIPRPTGRELGALTLIGQSPALVEARRRTSYMQQWNIAIQRLLPSRLVLEVAYVGSHGLRLPFANMNLNQLPTQFIDYARENFGSARDVNGAVATSVSQFFNQQVTNPFFGVITNPNSPLAARTVTRERLLRPYPQYDSPTLYRPLIGASKYHALQVTVRKTYSNGLSAMGTYSWSKAIDIGGAGNNSGGGTPLEDIYNPASDYTLSSIDVPHRATTSFSYELPFLKKHNLLGGWQLSGTTTWQAGTPVGVTTSNGIGLGFAVRRPDRTGVPAEIPVSDMRDNIRGGGFAFNPEAYGNPAEFTLGNGARNSSDTRRDPYRAVNMSVLKNFRWDKGRQRIQLRAEFLNMPNLVVFGTPGRDVNNRDLVQNGVIVRPGTFARVTTQGNQPRTIQLVLRYTF
ncbi:MAG: TonB-dependent receptor [Bryobacteraceae bacterium]|nr:TonB-dependent receptor [Bryobacteraceae bacterium]